MAHSRCWGLPDAPNWRGLLGAPPTVRRRGAHLSPISGIHGISCAGAKAPGCACGCGRFARLASACLDALGRGIHGQRTHYGSFASSNRTGPTGTRRLESRGPPDSCRPLVIVLPAWGTTNTRRAGARAFGLTMTLRDQIACVLSTTVPLRACSSDRVGGATPTPADTESSESVVSTPAVVTGPQGRPAERLTAQEFARVSDRDTPETPAANAQAGNI